MGQDQHERTPCHMTEDFPRPNLEGRGLQEDVAARVPCLDEERRGADQLNLELHGRIPIGVAVQDPPGIPERTRPSRRGACPDEGLVAGHRGIGINIAQIDLVAKIRAPPRKIEDRIPHIAHTNGAVADRIVIEDIPRTSAPTPLQSIGPGPPVQNGSIDATDCLQQVIAVPTIEHTTIIGREMVIASPTIERAEAVPPKQRIVASLPVQRTAVVIGLEVVIAVPAVERAVFKTFIDQPVVEVRAGEILNAQERVAPGPPRYSARPPD